MRRTLGYEETAQWLQQRIETCHTSNKQAFRDRLKMAQGGAGRTLFDLILEIVEIMAAAEKGRRKMSILNFNDAR